MRPHPTGAADRPLVTWYHAALGQRVELSLRTFGNWVAKTANLLVDELGLEPGDRAGVLLPSHWLGPVVLAACWRAGVSAVPAGPGRTGARGGQAAP
ncbi:MAG TPA: TIGR03089 family protein, partial [Actinomycetota bacterium]|nr:TIGR03089 family protein [Actinomycetota bacterium]